MTIFFQIDYSITFQLMERITGKRQTKENIPRKIKIYKITFYWL